MESGGLSEIATGDGVLRLVQEDGAPAALAWESGTETGTGTATGIQPEG